MKKDVWLTISSQQQFAGCDEENIDLQTRRGDPPAAAAIFIPVNPSKEVLFHAKDSCQ